MALAEKPETVLSQGPGVLFREGVDSFVKGDAEEAVQYFRQVLRHAKKTGDQNNVAWSLLHIGMVLRDQREGESALEVLEDAQRIFSGLRNDRGRAAVLQELSLVNREMDRNSLALEYAHQSLQILESIGKTLDLAWGYDNMAVIHLNMSHRHESLTYAKKARALFLEFGSHQGLAWNACNLGQLYFEMGFFPKAEQYFSEAVRTFTSIKNPQGQAWSQLGLGAVYRAQARFDAALAVLDKAKTGYKALNLRDRVGWCLLHEAAIKHITGDDEDALLLNRRALQLFSPLRSHDGVGWAMFQIGQIYRTQGLWMKSWQQFREAINLHTDINNKKGLGWAENEWAETYLELNDLSHARECLIKSKVLADQVDELPLKADVDKNIGRLHLEEGHLQKAAALLEKAEADSHRIQFRTAEAEVLLERVRFFIVIGDLIKARQCLRQASGIIQIYNLNYLKPSLGVFLGEVLMGEGKTENALKVWRDVVEMASQTHQKRQRAEALLGIAQALAHQGLPSQVSVMLNQIEKDVRALSSRKLKAKFLAVKGLVQFAEKRSVDMKSFAQSLQILQTTGLPVVTRHTLGLLSDLYRQCEKEKERGECEASIRHLLEKGAVDLHLVMPRHVTFKHLPISLVA